MGFDLKLFELLNGLAGKSPLWDKVFIFFAEYFWYFLILLFVIWLFTDRRQSSAQKWFWFFTAFGSAGIARGVITEIIRYFYHHSRPFVENPVVVLIEENSHSFPSGHVIFIFALAAVAYFYNKKLGWIIGIGGLVVGLARVIAGVHWPSDILGGIIIGVLFAVFSYKVIARKLRALAIF